VPLLSRATAALGFLNVRKVEGGSAMGMTIVYVVVSLVVCIAYFTAVDHFLMESQGLDYWYLFRK
jgi:hypothetical protein